MFWNDFCVIPSLKRSKKKLHKMFFSEWEILKSKE